MKVQDVISKIEEIDRQIKNLTEAENKGELPDEVYGHDVADLLTEYKVLLLEMKIEKQ